MIWYIFDEFKKQVSDKKLIMKYISKTIWLLFVILICIIFSITF